MVDGVRRVEQDVGAAKEAAHAAVIVIGGDGPHGQRVGADRAQETTQRKRRLGGGRDGRTQRHDASIAALPRTAYARIAATSDPWVTRPLTLYKLSSNNRERETHERDTGNRHPGRRMLLVPRSSLQGTAGRELGDVRLCRRPCAEPQLPGGLHRPHRPCRGRAGQVRPERTGLR